MTPELFERVLERDDLAELDPAARRLALRALLADSVDGSQLAAVVAELADVIDGHGPLSGFMRDDEVTDVLVNGTTPVWVERGGRLRQSEVSFGSHDELLALIERMIGSAGGRVDVSQPIADARLADGSRLHVVLPPVAPGGPLISIRRFGARRLAVEDLIASGMFDSTRGAELLSYIRRRAGIAISGATGTGKTTLLNALLGHVGPDERVVCVEEVPELQPACSHVVSLVTRPSNVEGAGEVDLTSLVRAALRMRPDRIVVGEVRGAEAFQALGAMSTGHEGSMITVHAGSPTDALDRLVMLALQASSGASEGALERQVRRAIDVVVQLERDECGVRRLAAIAEID
jgi:pilus assembly protein CpaF